MWRLSSAIEAPPGEPVALRKPVPQHRLPSAGGMKPGKRPGSQQAQVRGWGLCSPMMHQGCAH